MSTATFPTVSIILPTLNAGALLENCLASIAAQTWPKDRLEIVIADAFSTDNTRDIAKKFGAIVIDDRGKNMEEGKRLALQHATGEYIIFVDADNEFTHPDCIELAVRALEKNPQALGVESYYLPSPKMSSFCRYVTARLHISDPLCWMLTTNPILVARENVTATNATRSGAAVPAVTAGVSPAMLFEGETPSAAGGTPAPLPQVERWTLPAGSLSYPLGANGFVFRRADLESVKAGEHFQDTHVALHLMRAGKREWLRLRGRGVHHYYIQSLWTFVRKRRRATVHFLRVQEEMPVNWMKEKPPVPTWLAGLYCVSGIAPLYHALRGWRRDGDAAWLWHVPASLGSVLGAAWGVWTYKTNKGNRKLIADLQVKQTLRK